MEDNMDAGIDMDAGIEDLNVVTEADEDGKMKPSVPKDKKSGRKDGGKVGTYVHKFKKPFVYEDVKYQSINFYFDRLTGGDLIAVENEMHANSEIAFEPSMSRSFLCKMAAKAGSIGADAIEAMHVADFMQITNAARRFLTSSGY